MSELLNRDEMCFHLNEAKQDLDQLIEEIYRGDYDDSGTMVLRLPFEHIMNELCMAWHRRHLSNAEINATL